MLTGRRERRNNRQNTAPALACRHRRTRSSQRLEQILPSCLSAVRTWLGQSFTARWPLFRPDCLEQQTVNRTSIGAARFRAGWDEICLLCPHSAAIKGALPRCVTEARRLRADVVRVLDGTEEMGDDLEWHPEDVREKCGFRSSIVDGPGGA